MTSCSMPMEADLMKPAYFMIHESIDNPWHFKDNTLHHSLMHISVPFLSIFFGLSRTFFRSFHTPVHEYRRNDGNCSCLGWPDYVTRASKCFGILDRESDERIFFQCVISLTNTICWDYWQIQKKERVKVWWPRCHQPTLCDLLFRFLIT